MRFDPFGVDEPPVGLYSFRVFSHGVETIVTQDVDCTDISHWVVERMGGGIPPMLSIRRHEPLTTQRCIEVHRAVANERRLKLS